MDHVRQHRQARHQIVALVHAIVNRMATLSADEASHWDILHAGWSVDRVNHSEVYSDHGKHTNWAESYLSRLRRMVQGQHHHVSPKYLHQYANQAAWLEDNRRTNNGGLAFGLMANAMESPVSRAWKGCWQRVARYAATSRPRFGPSRKQSKITKARPQRRMRLVEFDFRTNCPAGSTPLPTSNAFTWASPSRFPRMTSARSAGNALVMDRSCKRKHQQIQRDMLYSGMVRFIYEAAYFESSSQGRLAQASAM